MSLEVCEVLLPEVVKVESELSEVVFDLFFASHIVELLAEFQIRVTLHICQDPFHPGVLFFASPNCCG